MANRFEQVVRVAAAPLFAVRCAGALLTAILLSLAFPTPDQGWLAWVALVPLILACERLKAGAALALGLLSGVATAFGIFWWLFEVPGFRMHHALILALYVGSYTAAWCGGLPLLMRTPMPLLVSAPALWVVLDYLKAHAGFLALPWATLAHTQHKNLAILQVASLTGEYGVTFLVVMGSVAAAELLTQRARRGVLVAGLVIGVAHAGGAVLLERTGKAPGIRVAVVQPNIRPGEQRTPSDRAAVVARLERLTLSAAATSPALIVWPETAVGDFSRDRSLVERLQALALAARTPMIVGASESFKFAPREAEIMLRVQSHNSAYFVSPGEPIGEPYRKMRLVPFAEYRPLGEIIRWPEWLIPRVHAMTPGEVRQRFALSDGTLIGLLICWENLFADFARPSVRDGSRLLVQLTNDAWFGRTGAPRQHNLASVLRAVENRTPVVIASNTGPSQIIDPYGRIVARVPDIFREGVTVGEVRLGSGGTLYTRVGNLFVLAVIGCLAIGAAWRVLQGALGCRLPVRVPPS
jgi:apolipoprotein N-acyltransferase